MDERIYSKNIIEFVIWSVPNIVLLSNVFRNWRKKNFSIKSLKYYHCYI